MVEKNSVNKEHSYYMKAALKMAKIAAKKDEVPIGAVVVDKNGVIVAKACNSVHRKRCQTQHAEIKAIKKACKKLGDWRLDGYWIYVTLEPCTMCYGLIKLCRLSGLVFGAESSIFGYRLDNSTDIGLYKKDAIEIVGGVLKDEAVNILGNFFKDKRKKGESRKK
jgi:tRNA(adenine34) deaminase